MFKINNGAVQSDVDFEINGDVESSIVKHIIKMSTCQLSIIKILLKPGTCWKEKYNFLAKNYKWLLYCWYDLDLLNEEIYIKK